MNLDWMTNPAWWALIVSLTAAAISLASARAATHNARITKADALVCRVDLRLERGDSDQRNSKAGVRQLKVVNRGEEVAFDVTIDRDGSGIDTQEVLSRTLNKGESLQGSFSEPEGEGPHFFVFTFRRPRELGGELKRVSLKYDPKIFD